MHINQRGIDIIKTCEGFKPSIYLCPAGKPTIGYGHLIKSGETFPAEITEHQASAILATDCVTAEQAVTRLAPEIANDNQFSALVSFVFNLGSGRFQSSTLRMKARRGENVRAELMKWTLCNGKRLNGLVMRRAMEADLYEG